MVNPDLANEPKLINNHSLRWIEKCEVKQLSYLLLALRLQLNLQGSRHVMIFYHHVILLFRLKYNLSTLMSLLTNGFQVFVPLG